jgi:NADPH:quinone reductase-like Zn-dependent oxidoreductase
MSAAHGLFDKSRLDLTPPSAKPHKKDKVVLVWGGSSSVGSSAIQLAKNAGYDIIATASKKNFGLVHAVGAETVVDYGSETAVQEILHALKGRQLVGALDAISSRGPDGTVQKCITVLLGAQGAKKRIATLLPGTEEEAREGVHIQSLFATKNLENENAAHAWKFLHTGLEKGLIAPKPEPKVVGHGLESIQGAVDLMGVGVSAEKIVVKMQDEESKPKA